MRCLKSFSERIAARDPGRQTAEIRIRIALMNRFNTLGTAETMAWHNGKWERPVKPQAGEMHDADEKPDFGMSYPAEYCSRRSAKADTTALNRTAIRTVAARAANIWSIFMRPADWIIAAPSPRELPTHSPTTAAAGA